MKAIRCILISGLVTLAQSGLCGTIRSTGELKAAFADIRNAGQTFDVTGTVRSYHPDYLGAWLYSIYDGTNSCFVSEPSVPGKSRPDHHAFGLLDRIRVSGRIEIVEESPRAVFNTAELLSQGDLAHIPEPDTDGLTEAACLGQMVRLRGRIRDAARDDTDATYICMTLCDEKGLVHLMVIEPPQFPSDFLQLIGAEVVVTGICADGSEGLRRHFGPYLTISGLENIVVSSAPDSFSTAPNLASLGKAHPRHIAAAGFHQTAGVVLAAWNGNAFLIQTPEGHLVRVRMQQGTPPAFGDNVRVLGLPVTDSFHINFVHATWEPIPDKVKISDDPIDAQAADLTTNKHGDPQLMMLYYGKTVRLTGLVRYIPDATHSLVPMQIESDGQIVAVDYSMLAKANKSLEIGCRVSIVGTCMMDIGDSDTEFGTHAKARLLLVPRTSDDIVILSRPSWWTTGRLMTLLGIFATALVGTIAWNMSLNRRAREKGKALAAEQLAHVTSELKVAERTRLAFELHDALSQTLSGVSMQIDTAMGFASGVSAPIAKCLGIASRAIDSCRIELRNTLWDLRSAALDEPDMNTAIKKSLYQSIAGIELSVRFNIPRETFSDNTTHAILKIVRELVSNAIRHGKATSVRIAGTVDDDKVLFSVKDNGCGFDPDLAPGIGQGHFGLQGITERLERLNGTLSIKCTPGKGAKITVTIPVHSGGK